MVTVCAAPVKDRTTMALPLTDCTTPATVALGFTCFGLLGGGDLGVPNGELLPVYPRLKVCTSLAVDESLTPLRSLSAVFTCLSMVFGWAG